MTTAMTSKGETGKFRKIWIEKFDEQARLQGRRLPRDFWEGYYAYRELDDTRNLWRVLPSDAYGDGLLNVLLEKLLWEVHVYKLYEESVVADNQNFGDAIAALAAAETKLKNVRTQKSPVKPEVDWTLSQCTSAIEKTRRSLEKRWDSYWQDVLFAPPRERKNWTVYVDDKKQLHWFPPDELTKAEKIFENAKYPRDLVRQLDLDRRFQLRVAVILRLHLRQDFGVSLKTISRLIVLTYICGRLRVEGPNRLFVLSKPNAKSGDITVGRVYQKLHTAGMK
jgi:hypothetical protein